MRQHSLYLINDFGYEIRDLSGLSEDILYGFIHVTDILTHEEVLQCLINAGVAKEKTDVAFKLLLWYGVLGIASTEGHEKFIYDYDYNFKRLEAEVRAVGEERLYIVNPALHVALKR